MYPLVGNQPRSTARYWIISSASQNAGEATPISETSRISWSGHRSRNIAATTPNIRASTIAITTPKSVSCSVSGIAVAIELRTGALVSALVPMSPRTSWPTKRTYRTGSGSSRPLSTWNW